MMTIRSRWPAATLAAASTVTAASISIVAGWQRGGWLPERLLWIAIGVVLVVSAHLLPAMCRSASAPGRAIGVVLWIACMGATCYGHATFFVFAQQHAGQRRAQAIMDPAPVAPAGRTVTQIADDRAAAVAELVARCTTGCAARRTALKARLDALDVDMAEARRLEAQADRVTVEQDRAKKRRDDLRADPVTSRVAALVGVPVARVDLLTGLAFAAVLECIACFCWFLAFDVPAARERQSESQLTPVTATRVSNATATPVTPVMESEPADLAKIKDAIAAGRLRGTVAEIRKHLGCSQSRAMAVRRQLAAGARIA